MLETLLSGWYSKIFVLILLGFAATDFIITITLSAADAALHMVENPLLHEHLGHGQLGLTVLLISLLAVVFLKGFSEAIGLAILIGVPYILLNIVVLVFGVLNIYAHPEAFLNWKNLLVIRGDWTSLLFISVLVFPKLALGMSGFETGVSVMPHVSGNNDDSAEKPLNRIKNTHKLLTAAAVIMSILLLLSSFVTTLLIPEAAYQAGGEASGRALSYLAHQLIGRGFGSVYDFSTILVLWFAGASAMAGMLNLIPRYLPRFGMAPRWVAYRRPLVLVLFAVSVFVTWIFDANVEAQGSAYATGVLALMLSAAVAVALAFIKESKSQSLSSLRTKLKTKSYYFWIVAFVFAFTFFDNVILKPEGLIIACCFIFAILALGGLSRWYKSLDLRVLDVSLKDQKSKEIWNRICNKKIHLIPITSQDYEWRTRKTTELQKHYSLKGQLAFLNVKLVDNRSEFSSALTIECEEGKDGNILIVAHGATAIANSIAYISELLNPIGLYIGLTRSNLMSQSFRYLLWGEGETGLLVYRILLRYWEWTPEDDVRPNIFLFSE
jgi:hypothetical protein